MGKREKEVKKGAWPCWGADLLFSSGVGDSYEWFGDISELCNYFPGRGSTAIPST